MLHIIDSMNYSNNGSICSSTKQTVSSQQLNSALRLFEQKRKPNHRYFTVRSWQSHAQNKAMDYPLLDVKQNHSYQRAVVCSIRNLFKRGGSGKMVSGLCLRDVRFWSAMAKEISWLRLFVLFHKSPRKMRGKFLTVHHSYFLNIHSIKLSIHEFWRQITKAVDRTSLHNVWPVRNQSGHWTVVRGHPFLKKLKCSLSKPWSHTGLKTQLHLFFGYKWRLAVS